METPSATSTWDTLPIRTVPARCGKLPCAKATADFAGALYRMAYSPPLPSAAVALTRRNTRRYGGYLVHMGIVLMFIGFTGAAFNQAEVKELKVGESMRIGHYDLRTVDVQEGDNENYSWHRAVMQVSKNGSVLSPGWIRKCGRPTTSAIIPPEHSPASATTPRPTSGACSPRAR